uniref:ORF7 n=1 Tax=Malaco herpesvirus 4 TaxID=3031800 RepID=A0AA48P8X9_9VIRU|nr:TPA_asm: ORF7 [Malaco herpesvirus 4]
MYRCMASMYLCTVLNVSEMSRKTSALGRGEEVSVEEGKLVAIGAFSTCSIRSASSIVVCFKPYISAIRLEIQCQYSCGVTCLELSGVPVDCVGLLILRVSGLLMSTSRVGDGAVTFGRLLMGFWCVDVGS